MSAFRAASHSPLRARAAAALGRAMPRGAALLLALLTLGACGDEGAAEARALHAEAAAALAAGEKSRALHLAKRGLDRHGPQAELLQVAAAACNALERHSEAATFALQGLDLAGKNELDLRADLQFERAQAALGAYLELKRADDWSQANVLFEDATKHGRRRAEAASRIVALQFLDGRRNVERAQRFARLALELDPAGRPAQAARELLLAQGIEL